MTIADITRRLQEVYTRSIGYEMFSSPNKAEREWLCRMLEESQMPSTPQEQRRQLELLVGSEAFDSWCGRRFPNVKRYSLEGAESMLVAIDTIFASAAGHGVDEAVLTIAHRGRLNLLVQLLDFDLGLLIHKMSGKSEISDKMLARGFTGDVLSHLHGSPTLDRYARPLRVHLLPNPSHLEAVNPVGLGVARALQIPERADQPIGEKVISVQVHGDAAWSGQGIVFECLQLQSLPHFNVGGTVRLVVNNQVGFTNEAKTGRSSLYASDIAKAIGAPVFHVNADKPAEVVKAVKMACKFQREMRRDVVIDLISYRRHGHNELDQPAFTNPAYYTVVSKLQSQPAMYEKALIEAGTVTADEAKSFKDSITARLETAYGKRESFVVPDPPMRDGWQAMTWPRTADISPATGVDVEALKKVGRASVATPQGFNVHPSLEKRHVARRLQSIESGRDIDFGSAEALAFGSLMLEGNHVRLSGQDSARGTFSQRHGVLTDQTTYAQHVPLNTLDSTGRAEFVSAPLSEFSVVGFETGFSYVAPTALPLHEQQYGDFADGSQVILDTFLGGAESKWLLQSALTLLLPHGADVGAGPEHSSGRIERFLQLTNEPLTRGDYNANMHCVLPSTAAQYFHVLRRQLVRSYRKPLVCFTPKATLRLPATYAQLPDLSEGTSWQPVLPDTVDPTQVERVVLLSGKLYFALADERAKRKLDNIAFIRIEELSPFPYDAIEQALAPYTKADSFVFAQEEPENAGFWTFAKPRLEQIRPDWQYVGRRAMATPANGIAVEARREAAEIVQAVFAGL